MSLNAYKSVYKSVCQNVYQSSKFTHICAPIELAEADESSSNSGVPHSILITQVFS